MKSRTYQAYLEKLEACIEAVSIYDEDGYAYEDGEEGMEELMELFLEVRRSGRHLFFIGNGGSAGIASHMTADFLKNGRMKAISLYDSSVVTCLGNDYGYEQVFSKSLELLAEEEDLLVAVSSSGNSLNIVKAIETAKEKGMHIITMSGFDKENRIRRLGEINVHVPVEHYGMVESIHNLMLQQVVDVLMERDEIRS